VARLRRHRTAHGNRPTRNRFHPRSPRTTIVGRKPRGDVFVHRRTIGERCARVEGHRSRALGARPIQVAIASSLTTPSPSFARSIRVRSHGLALRAKCCASTAIGPAARNLALEIRSRSGYGARTSAGSWMRINVRGRSSSAHASQKPELERRSAALTVTRCDRGCSRLRPA
jgi:hypothetical protein